MGLYTKDNYKKIEEIDNDQFISVFTKKGENVIITVEDFLNSTQDTLEGDFLPLDGSGEMDGIFVPNGFVPVSGTGDIGQTIDLYAANSNNILFSGGGADEIVSFGTAPAGTIVYFRINSGGPGHPGGSQITASTDILTLDGENIFTEATATYVFQSHGSGIWKQIQYIAAPGTEAYLRTTGGIMTGNITDSSELNYLQVLNENDMYLVAGRATATLYLSATNTVNMTANGGASIVVDGTNDDIHLTTTSGITVDLLGASGFYIYGNNNAFLTINDASDIATIGSTAGVFSALTDVMRIQMETNKQLEMVGLPSSNAGLTTGQIYKASAATILANGDLILGIKV